MSILLQQRAGVCIPILPLPISEQLPLLKLQAMVGTLTICYALGKRNPGRRPNRLWKLAWQGIQDFCLLRYGPGGLGPTNTIIMAEEAQSKWNPLMTELRPGPYWLRPKNSLMSR